MLNEQKLTLLDPRRCAQAGQILQGELLLSKLSLPAEVLGQAEGVVHYHVTFGIDDQDYVFIKGRVEAELSLECQRCLNPMVQSIKSLFCLSPVRTGQEAEALPEHYEPVFMEGEKLSLSQIVEEELILNLPIAPMHVGECKQIVSH